MEDCFQSYVSYSSTQSWQVGSSCEQTVEALDRVPLQCCKVRFRVKISVIRSSIDRKCDLYSGRNTVIDHTPTCVESYSCIHNFNRILEAVLVQNAYKLNRSD
jgi:hypothetical protein